MPMLRRLLALFLLLASAAAPLPAQPTGAPENKKNYVHRIQLADRIRVSIYQEEELNTISRVDARGRINLPLLAEIEIGGLTIVGAQEKIQRAFQEGRFLRAPQVTVSVEEYAPRLISVMGQVRNAAQYPLPIESTYTVVEAITKAGGITDIGKGSEVTITRVHPDGTKQVFKVNVDNVIKGRKGDGKIDDNTLLLQPGDIVFVPERLI